MYKRTLLKLSLIIVSFCLYSQDNKWSLEKCIGYALEYNIQIKQYELNSKYYENNYRQSKTATLPNLNFNADHSYSFGKALDYSVYEYKDQTIQSNSFRLSSSVPLFQGLQNKNTIEKNNFDLLASIQDVEQIKNNVSLTIASAFLNILFNKELVTIAREQLALTNLQVERTSKLAEAGSVALGKLLEIQAQAAGEELKLINAQNQLDISYLTLMQLLELDSITNFEVENPKNLTITEYIYDSLSIYNIYNQSVLVLPQIKSAGYKLKSSEKQLSIAKGGISPSLSLTASYGSRYSDAVERNVIGDNGQPLLDENLQSVMENYPFPDQLKDYASTSIAFNLRVPIFNGYLTKTNIENAKIGILNSELELQNQKNQLFKEIQQAYADAIAANKKYLATEKALVAMKESFRYTQEKFEVGLINTVDYNAAKNQLAQTESELLQAKYEYIFKTKILDFYRGIPIKL
ncbi:MAG: TolC family protein [Bacteroidales bacterium]|nr:TolC family protein [Bacteroidales bacterium]